MSRPYIIIYAIKTGDNCAYTEVVGNSRKQLHVREDALWIPRRHVHWRQDLY